MNMAKGVVTCSNTLLLKTVTARTAMDAQSQERLKKKLLHYGRPQLVKELKRRESSRVISTAIYGSKNDLIARIIDSIRTKQTKKNRKRKKRKENRKPLTMNHPIYNDEKEGELNNVLPKKRKKKPLKKHLKPAPDDRYRSKSHTIAPRKKKKVKPKRKHRLSVVTDTETKQEKHEKIMKYIYVIINMKDRPLLNDKQCKIVSIINKNKYRVRLISNGSQHLISPCNLKKMGKHRRKKAIHIPSSPSSTNEGLTDIDDESTTAETGERMTPFPIDCKHTNILAIGVFVDYQMILKLFIDTESEHLFGTKYRCFKTECFWFLEEIYYERKEFLVNYKDIDTSFTMAYYKCNDKQIVFLMKYNGIQTMNHIQTMDCAMICVCNAYKNMLSNYDKLCQVFRLHDEYGFGEINKKEFNKFLSALTVKTQITESSSSALFDRIDADEIKAITLNQFTKYMMERKKVLWELLLELAQEYELDTDLSVYLHQIALSKIHKLILIMYDMYEGLLLRALFSNDIDIWEKKMLRYIEFIKTNQIIIDDRLLHLKKDENKSINIKYVEKSSEFIHNNMPDIA